MRLLTLLLFIYFPIVAMAEDDLCRKKAHYLAAHSELAKRYYERFFDIDFKTANALGPKIWIHITHYGVIIHSGGNEIGRLRLSGINSGPTVLQWYGDIGGNGVELKITDHGRFEVRIDGVLQTISIREDLSI